MSEEIDKKILHVLKKASKPLSKAEVARQINLTTATAAKYIDILEAKGIIKITKYGNIHLAELK